MKRPCLLWGAAAAPAVATAWRVCAAAAAVQHAGGGGFINCCNWGAGAAHAGINGLGRANWSLILSFYSTVEIFTVLWRYLQEAHFVCETNQGTCTDQHRYGTAAWVAGA